MLLTTMIPTVRRRWRKGKGHPLTTVKSLEKFRYQARVDDKVGEAFPLRIGIAGVRESLGMQCSGQIRIWA